MAWDANRPVPWQRLVREWLVYVTIMAAVFVAFFRDRGLIGILGGLLASGPLYLAIGYVLAKLGFQRKQWKELRSEARSAPDTAPETDADDTAARPRARPAPTKRTGGGTPPNRSKKRRR